MVARFNRRFPTRNPLSRRGQRDVSAIDTTLDSSRAQSKCGKTQDVSHAVADGATVASSDESHCTKETEPFDKMVDEPNEWHKSQGGGGCIIL